LLQISGASDDLIVVIIVIPNDIIAFIASSSKTRKCSGTTK